MNKQELLDKAVHELNGVLYALSGRLVKDALGNYIYETESGELARFSSVTFHNRASELGYGVEAAEPDSWYCYETQKSLRLPPVGVECEMSYTINENWHKCVYRGKTRIDTHIVEWLSGDVDSFGGLTIFRPLDWNRKAEAERTNLLEIVYRKWNERGDIKEVAEYLHDAGYLRLPADKS